MVKTHFFWPKKVLKKYFMKKIRFGWISTEILLMKDKIIFLVKIDKKSCLIV